MKKVRLSMLFLICFLLTLSVAAFSEGLDNEPLGLDLTEGKIYIQEELTGQVSGETLTEFISVELSQPDNFNLLYSYTIYFIYIREEDLNCSYNKIKNTVNIRSPDILLAA